MSRGRARRAARHRACSPSHWQPGNEHLLGEFAGAGGVKLALQEQPHVGRFDAELVGDATHVVAVPGQPRLQLVELARQRRVHHGVLSIVLAGHPRLRNALMRPNMEEVGFRFAVFPFEGMAGHQAGYIAWLLGRCLSEGTDPASIIDPNAVDLLAARLRTPLQVERVPPDTAASLRCRRRRALRRARSAAA